MENKEYIGKYRREISNEDWLNCDTFQDVFVELSKSNNNCLPLLSIRTCKI